MSSPLPAASPRDVWRGLALPMPRKGWLEGWWMWGPHRAIGRAGLQPTTALMGSLFPTFLSPRMGEFSDKNATCGTICLKYLLFAFNCCFWVRDILPPCLGVSWPSSPPLPCSPALEASSGADGPPGDCSHYSQLAGLAVMAVGIWTLAFKSDYISLLASGFYLASAYILVVAGVVVMVTGVLGCCATFKERRNLLRLVSGGRGGQGRPGAAGRGPAVPGRSRGRPDALRVSLPPSISSCCSSSFCWRPSRASWPMSTTGR